MHHSDQGSQYTSEQFQRLLKDQGVIRSMSKRGDCWDNAAMESFFSSLNTERVARTVYRPCQAARDSRPRFCVDRLYSLLTTLACISVNAFPFKVLHLCTALA